MGYPHKSLRQLLERAAEELREELRKESSTENSTFTSLDLARKSGKTHSSVKSLLYRNPEFVEALGVKIEKRHNKQDYLLAMEKLANEKITHAKVASVLGVDRSSVSEFFANHLEIDPRRQAKKLIWKKGIEVNYLHQRTVRMTSKSVSPAEYIRLWDLGLLRFQQEKIPKPDHLPTREEALELL